METLFFYFLRRGLWETEEVYSGDMTMGPEDWERLFAMAHEQAVTGLVIDGVGQTDRRPDREVWEQWLIHLLYMEQMNRAVERCGVQWLNRLEKAGMAAFVVKGTSVAQWYRQPLHRSFGDVDIVIGNGWEKLVAMLTEGGYDCRNEHGDIVVQEDGRVPVEFHPQWEYVYNPIANARLRKLTRAADGKDRELYLVCLILHLRRHFLTYGIGLKQVCDVAVMLHRVQLDPEKVAALLKRLHAERFSRILFGFIANYIKGTEHFPLEPIRQGKDAVLFRNIVMNDAYRLKMVREEKAGNSRFPIGRILANACFWMRRGWRLLGMMPAEAICLPGYLVARRVRGVMEK